MDVSLDDYIKKKGGVKTKKASLAGRLGPKISPIRLKKNQQQHNTQFKVTGLGNVKKSGGSSKPLSVFDARIKIGKKDNFQVVKDARQRIGGGKAQGNDLRVKVNNMKAKKTDAREKIKARQQQQTGQQQQIVVTGLGRPIPSLVSTQRAGVQGKKPVVKQVGGSLMKTVVTTGQGKKSIKPQNRVKISSGAIKVTTRQQVDTTAAQQLPGFVKIKNDLYVPPPKPQPIVWHQQPQPQQQLQPQYIEPVRYYNQQPAQVRYQQPVEEMVYQPPVQSVQFEQPEPVYITRKQVHNPSPVVSDTGGPYRVMVTNLHPIVTQDDLVELFGSIGALKRARLLKPGLAEILYMKREDALNACKKYHMRELDGQPMQVNMTSLPKAKPPPSPPREHQPLFRHTASSQRKRISPPRRDDHPPPLESAVDDVEVEGASSYQPLRLGASDKPGPSRMDMGLVHKALFKTAAPGQPNRPVTFTVKI